MEKNFVKKLSIVTLVVVVMIGGACTLLTLFQNKDVEVGNIVWTDHFPDEDGYITGGAIYLYDNGKTEKAGDVALCHVSQKDGSLLVGVQNWYPNADGFKGIVTYDVSSKEVKEILECDKICDFLGDGNADFCGNVQMTRDGKSFYFACGGKMICYDAEKDKMEILFEASCHQYSLNENGTCLYFSADATLFRYDLSTNAKEVLLKDVWYFSVSKDEKAIAYENRDEQALYLHRVDTGEDEKIADLNYIGSTTCISEDNRYVLYTDYKEAVVPTNRRIEIYVLELDTGKRKLIYKGNYKENIEVARW